MTSSYQKCRLLIPYPSVCVHTIFIGIVLGWIGWQGPLLVNLEWVAGSQSTSQVVEALGRGRVTIAKLSSSSVPVQSNLN